MPVHGSREDYMETIYLLHRKHGSVRSVDVAAELGYSRPSVSRAVGILKDSGYITVAGDGELELTKDGEKIAKSVFDKHLSLIQFLMLTTGVEFEDAEADACRMEHIVSTNVFKGIKKFLSAHRDEVENLMSSIEDEDYHSVTLP